jgi:hypothetical protein
MLAPVIVGLMASPSAIDFVPPTDSALEDALNELEVCRSSDPADCWSPMRAYKVHGARCMPIAPEAQKPTIACRVDMTLTYEDPARGYKRYHDWCGRFSKHGVGEGKPEWKVVQVRDRPCEVLTKLTRDPNPLPKQVHIERGLVGMLSCSDLDGMKHCSYQPESARVSTFRCKPIEPGEEYSVRVACRVSGNVLYSTGRVMRRLRHECIRLDRITPADESPAYWVAIYVPDDVKCEV